VKKRVVSISLATVLVVSVGLIGCGSEEAQETIEYNLTISSTDGGSVTTPGEGTFAYDEGEVVNLVAVAEEGYHFDNWTGDVGTVANVYNATTTITMNGDYEVTANFEEIPSITFAIAGPMTDVRGKHHWWGAELARDEINAGSGVNVGGVYHQVRLIQVDTNEILGAPEEGVTALQTVIDDVNFVVGGFTTANVAVYREVAMDAKKIFMDCGANTASLQYSVVDNYARYKYWFKGMPINESFCVLTLFRMITAIGGILKNKLMAEGDAVTEDYRVPEDGKLRVALVIDNRWGEGLGTAVQGWLPFAGFTGVGTWQVSPTASDISPQLTAVKATKPHIILCAFAGPVSVVYSKEKVELGIPAMTIGFNDVEGQMESHWADTDGSCNGEIQLDGWAEGSQNTVKTAAFIDVFTAKTGEYPIYPAGSYNAIYQLKEAIEAVSATHDWDDIADVVDPANIDALIQYLETSAYTGIAARYAYYPMPTINLGNGVYALSEAQVRALYPGLVTYNQANWLCAALGGPHIAHDLVYGPGYVTGIGSQWQDGHKVGVWPMDRGDAYDAPLSDQYGNWNFQYAGTKPLLIPIEGFLAS
jgi:branched-chain amino acid transport system substrate-binding protein